MWCGGSFVEDSATYPVTTLIWICDGEREKSHCKKDAGPAGEEQEVHRLHCEDNTMKKTTSNQQNL